MSRRRGGSHAEAGKQAGGPEGDRADRRLGGTGIAQRLVEAARATFVERIRRVNSGRERNRIGLVDPIALFRLFERGQ